MLTLMRLRRLFTITALTIAFIGALAGEALATHLRGVTLSWAPTGITGQVEFTLQFAARWSFYGNPALNSNFSVPLNFGDNTSGSAIGQITSINQAEDWFTATLKVKKTYAGAGPYTAFYTDCCRISTLKLGRDQTMRMETRVTPLNGNRPPTSSMPAIVTVPLLPTTGFAVTGLDADRDTLTYRFATNAEMYGGSAIGQPPGLTINPTTGQATWITGNVPGGIPTGTYGARVNGELWTAQIMIEDRDAQGNVKSKVPVDIILKFVTQVGTAPSLVINPAGPLSVQAGSPVTFTVTGNDVDNNARVSLNGTGIPTGATATNLNQLLVPPVTSTFTWTPTAAQSGSHVITFTATDDSLQQTLKTISIFVENNLPPTITGPATHTTPFTPQAPITVQVADPNGDPLTVTWEVDNVLVRTDTVPATQNTTTLTFAGFGNVGPHSVKTTVKDSKNAMASLSTAVTVTKAPQSILDFDPIPDKILGDPPFTVTATASSGLPVVFSVLSGNASMSGNQVTLTGGGPVTIQAFQAGDGNFDPAAATQSFNVTVLDLDVTSITLETRPWNGHTPTSSADAINTFNSLAAGVPGYSPAPKTLTIFSGVSNHGTFGGTVNNIGYHHHFEFNAPMDGTLAIRMGADFGKGGTLVIDGVVVEFANHDMWWNGSYADPSQTLEGTVNITAGPHTIDSYGFEQCCDGAQEAQYSYRGAPYKIFTAPANEVPAVVLTGPASVSIGSTHTYDFTVTDPDPGATFSVVSLTCGANGAVEGTPIVTAAGGSFDCAFSSTPGSSTVAVRVKDNRGAHSNTGAIVVTITKLAQTITFAPLGDKTYGDPDFGVSATASSNLPVTFAATGDCSVSGSTVNLTGAGACTITASQPGDTTTYAPAPDVARSFNIAKAEATVLVTGYTGVYDGDAHGATGTATGVKGESLSSLLDLGDSFTDVPGGTANWAFAGNTNYNPQSGTAAIVISKAEATVSVNGYTGVYDGDAHGATGTATGVKGESLSSLLDLGDSFTDVPGGTANWAFAGNTNYNPQSGTAAIVISKADATVSVNGHAGVYDGDAHGATGTATGVKGESLSSLLDLGASFTNVPGGTANWAFAGNTNYNPQSGTAAIAISKADATVSVNGYTGVYDGDAHGATGTATGVKGESLSSLLTLGDSFTDVPGGTANWSFAGDTNYNGATGTASIVISKANGTVSVNGYTGIYDGDAHGATGTATGVKGESLSSLLSLGATFTDGPGGIAYWSFAGNANYAAQNGEVEIAITKAVATISVSGYSGVYDTAAHGATGTATGVKGESLSALLDLGASFTNAPGGTAHWTFAGNNNYQTASGDVSVTITKAALTVTADDKSKLLGAPLPVFTASYSGFMSGEGPASLGGSLQFSTAATAASPVGTYPITPGGLTSGNYSITFVAGTLNITYDVCLGYDPTKAHNSGSTIPIKLQLCGASGPVAGSPSIVVHATELVKVSDQATDQVEDAGQANPDDDFRLVGVGYIFNLQTKGLTTGTYKLVFTVTGDPEPHSVFFQIK